MAGELQLTMYEGETVFFTDVLLAMTREMVKEVGALLCLCSRCHMAPWTDWKWMTDGCG